MTFKIVNDNKLLCFGYNFKRPCDRYTQSLIYLRMYNIAIIKNNINSFDLVTLRSDFQPLLNPSQKGFSIYKFQRNKLPIHDSYLSCWAFNNNNINKCKII